MVISFAFLFKTSNEFKCSFYIFLNSDQSQNQNTQSFGLEEAYQSCEDFTQDDILNNFADNTMYSTQYGYGEDFESYADTEGLEHERETLCPTNRESKDQTEGGEKVKEEKNDSTESLDGVSFLVFVRFFVEKGIS